jgi:hypothetical protein
MCCRRTQVGCGAILGLVVGLLYPGAAPLVV